MSGMLEGGEKGDGAGAGDSETGEVESYDSSARSRDRRRLTNARIPSIAPRSPFSRPRLSVQITTQSVHAFSSASRAWIKVIASRSMKGETVR